MDRNGPLYFNNPDELADFVIERMGMDINVGMVLGLGKPVTRQEKLMQKIVLFALRQA